MKNTRNGGTTWSNWGSFGGQLLEGTGPAAGAYYIFVTGTNHQLYWYTSSWRPSLGGYLTSSPADISRSSGTTDVFVRGGDGLIYWKEYSSGAWGGWSPIQGPP
jgi:hypothetical protein